MAFIRKSGSSFTVHHGITGQVISRHGSRQSAATKLDELHRKHKPSSAHRGKSARKAVDARRKRNQNR